MARLGSEARPLRVAVVGAGPAGLYAVQALLDQPGLVRVLEQTLVDLRGRGPGRPAHEHPWRGPAQPRAARAGPAGRGGGGRRPRDIELDPASRAGMAERNQLVVDPDGGLRSKGTGRFEVIEAGLVLRSIGYRTVPIEGVPFDPATSTLDNIAGQVVHPSTGVVVPGEYVAGWAKRGPTGRIGNNKPDSASTVAAMVADLPTLEGIPDDRRDPARVTELLRRRRVELVSYRDWRALDAHELATGAANGRPRVKLTTVSEMLEVIREARE